MTQLRNAFKREETLNSKKITRTRTHWRNSEDTDNIVSNTLDWDNVTRPENNPEFSETTVGTLGFTRHTPDEPTEWDTFTTEETYTPVTVDEYAHNQLVVALSENVNLLNAKEIAEFLHDRFTVEYDVELDNGNRALTRTFPYCRETILSEYPSKRELQIIQYTIDKIKTHTDDSTQPLSARELLQLFDLVEQGKEDSLITQALSYVNETITAEITLTAEDIRDEKTNPSRAKS